MYDPSVLSSLAFSSSDLYNCSTVQMPRISYRRMKQVLYENLTCTSNGKTICPINSALLHNFMRNSVPVNNTYSLCPAYRALENKTETVNVIVNGESPTVGNNARGCCCDRDSRCPALAQYCHDFMGASSDTNFAGVWVKICSWTQYLLNLLDRAYPNALVKKIRMDAGGRSSKSAAFYLPGVLKANGITHHKPTDIVIMDHGINDEWHPIEYPEEFFSTVLRHSVGAGPAIINFLSFSGSAVNRERPAAFRTVTSR